MSLFIESDITVDKEGFLNGDPLQQLLPDHETPAEKKFERILSQELSPDIVDFISQQGDFDKNSCVALLKTSTSFNVKNFPGCKKGSESYDLMVNVKPINDTRHINTLFVSFQNKLSPNGVFVGCVETYQLRKQRLLKKFPSGLNYIYYFFDYIFKRVFPKIKGLTQIYFLITAGRNRAISHTEALGRLNYCGFEVMDTLVDNNLMYFSAKKVHEVRDVVEKNYGMLLKLQRKGKGGKRIQVYKLRTMFPYAEYIQDYVYKQNQLQSGGKFQNDFRISMIGRFFRKYFLDEIPMIINLLKGDLKLVGVRPLSLQYFSLYDDELKTQRLNHKPGLIPPFYVDLPKTLQEIQDSEKKYLVSYEKAPLKTDVRYFFQALRNIVFRKARSK